MAQPRASSSEFLYDAGLPDYDEDENHSLPRYSQSLGSSECLLQYELPRRTGCPACEWIFVTKHVKINLGRRMWKMKGPAYGLNGKIEGSITFQDNENRVESIVATIEGRLTTATDRKGDPAPFLSRTFSIYSSGCPGSSPEDGEYPFTIPFPSHYYRDGKEFPLPPSFYFGEPNFMCDVSYTIKLGMSWKTKRKARYHEKSIGVYYLPKTTPSVPPINVLPPASRHCENPPLFLQGSNQMESFPITPRFSKKAKVDRRTSLTTLERHKDSVYLSLPTPACFTSGQEIPFMLSFCFPHDPFLADLLCLAPQVHLFKRIGICKPGSGEAPQEKDVLLSTALLKKSGGWAPGVVVVRGTIGTGDTGSESSWQLEGLAYVKYVLRISFKPPEAFASHIPAFTHEAVVDIATHNWGSLEREMVSSSGVTSPAVGLTKSLRLIY